MKPVKPEDVCHRKNVNKPELCITGLGLACSVGHDHKTACASMRAEFTRPEKLTHFYAENPEGYEDPDDGLVTGHPVLQGDADDRLTRMSVLLAMALDDLWSEAGGMDDRVDTLFCLALPGPERLSLDDTAMYRLIPEPLREMFPMDMCRFYPNGHLGMILAANDMAVAMETGVLSRAIIAGTDSLVGFDDLVRFERQNRLKTFVNSDGLMPGEAASAFILETRSVADARNAEILACIKGVATAMEVRHLLSGLPPVGSALASVIGMIMKQSATEELAVDAVIADLNGELYRFEEWALIQSRLGNRITGEKNLICPARFIGDTGAASPGAAVAVAVRGMALDYLVHETDEPEGKVLVVSCSDTGERGVLLIENVKYPQELTG